MNLQNWMSQAKAHWQEFQPTRFRELKKSGMLGQALQEAADRTYQEMNALTEAGFTELEAWEMVRQEYLFPPKEPALKAKSDRKQVASAAAGLFNEIADLKSEILGRLDAEEDE